MEVEVRLKTCIPTQNVSRRIFCKEGDYFNWREEKGEGSIIIECINCIEKEFSKEYEKGGENINPWKELKINYGTEMDVLKVTKRD